MWQKAGFLFALMLTLPAVANAWTITAKVGSGHGSIASDRATAMPAVHKTGTAPVIGYFTTATNATDDLTQVLTFAPDSNYRLSSVILDGVQKPEAVSTGSLSVPMGRQVRNHAVVAYYTAVTYGLTVTQPDAGGTVTVQRWNGDLLTGKGIGPISRTGFGLVVNGQTQPGLNNGDTIKVVAMPNSDYSVSSISNGSPITGTAGLLGDVVATIITYDSSKPIVTAAFSKAEFVKTRLKVYRAGEDPRNIGQTVFTVGDEVTFDASATTGNTNSFTYVYRVGNTVVQTPYKFNTPGTYTVSVTANYGAFPDNTATVDVTVRSLTETANSVCAACHKNRDAIITGGFASSGHNGHISCLDCHYAPHPSNASCLTCHKAPNAPLAHTADQSACNTCHIAPHPSVATVAICVTCHKAPNAPPAHTAAQNACNTCHDVHTLGFIAGTIAAQHTITSSTCADCHAAHTGGTAFLKAQYVSAASLPVSCVDCHGDWVNKTASQAILVQFAGSAHGDGAGEAWRHYDWRGANRSSCARCHAVTAFVAKLGKENDTSNVFLAGDVLKPGEVLACSACHTDAGALRTAAQDFAQSFTINMSNGATVTYDVAGASTLCARCHSGRETGASISADTDTAGVRVFVDSHYQPAAGTLYNKVGYEYAGQSYAGLGSHKLLGATSQGPCVTCHMSGKNHSFVAADCVTCHDGTTAALVDAATLKANYDAALNNLKLALAAKGIHYGPVHPFFFTAPYVAGATNVPVTNWAAPYGAAGWKNTMGAAFNYNMLWSEKGAYAHNYDYAMKLIADSIDFMSDGAVDGR